MKILYILSGLGVLALLAEIFRFTKYLLPIILVGLLCALACVVKDWNTDIHYYNDMLNFNNYALAFSAVMIASVFIWLPMSTVFFQNESSRSDHFALVLFSLIGAVLLASYSNLVMLFLGIEILSIPVYVLAGSRKTDLASNESALKYFLMGAFASGFLLFGVALIYGSCGTFNIHEIRYYLSTNPTFPATRGAGSELLLSTGIIFTLIGLGFKSSAAPFHFWTPDVYTGAPTPVTAFMSSVVKTAAFAALLRLFLSFAGVVSSWSNIVWAMAALTILIGNITAVYQSNVKRILAYSSVAHAGYMLLGILAMSENSQAAILFYTAAYSISAIATFSILAEIEKTETNLDWNALAGLSKRNPLMALSMSIALLSLAGIPPLAGFFGKYYIFTTALASGYTWLVLIAVLGSLIAVYYYLKVIIAMYLQTPVNTTTITISPTLKLFLVATIILTLLLGIFPNFVINLI